MKYELVDAVVACVACLFFVPSFLIYPGVVIYRQYALLRDVKPLYCMLNHFASIVFTTYLLIGWHRESQSDTNWKILLAVFQCIGTVFFFGFFVCKQYTVCQRYEASESTPLPGYVVFLLASFPFVIIDTYRLTKGNSAGYSDLAVGVVALLMLALVRLKFYVPDHPSPHFGTALKLELGVILLAAITSIIHNFVDDKTVMIPCVLLVSLMVNVSFLAYVVPPLYTKFRRRDEYSVYSKYNLSSKRTSGLDGVNHSPRGGAGCINNGLLDDNASFTANTENSWFGRLACKIIPRRPGTPASPSGGSSAFDETRQTLLLNQSIAKASTHLSVASTAAPPAPGTHRPSQELTQLLELIKDGDVRRVHAFLSKARLTVIHEFDMKGRTPLHHAVQCGDIATIRFLLQMGADRIKTDFKGFAPLHDAVRSKPRALREGKVYDQSNIVSELLEGGARGAVVNQATPQGFTALHYAVLRDALGTLHTLLRYDADPLHNQDKEDPDQSWQEVHTGNALTFDACRRSPIMLATELGLERHVSSMLQSVRSRGGGPGVVGGGMRSGAPEIRCGHGLTLLHVALSLGHAKVVSVLLSESRANPYAIQEEGRQNCFHFAALGGSCDALCQLLDAMDVPDVLPLDLRYDPSSPNLPRTPTLNSAAPPSFRSTSSRSGGGFFGGSVGLFPRSLGSFRDNEGGSAPTSANNRVPGSITGGGGVHSGKFLPSMSASSLPGSGPPRPNHMTVGEANTVLQRHIPDFSFDPKKLATMESKVDNVAAELKGKHQHDESARLQQAMLTMNRRFASGRRVASSRGFSLPPSQEAEHDAPSLGTSVASNPGSTTRVLDMLTAKDHLGMTPMCYAIRAAHGQMCTVLAASITALRVQDPHPHPGTPLRGPADSSAQSFTNSTEKDDRMGSSEYPMIKSPGLRSEGSRDTDQRSRGYSAAETTDSRFEFTPSNSWYCTVQEEHGDSEEAEDVMGSIQRGLDFAKEYALTLESAPAGANASTSGANASTHSFLASATSLPCGTPPGLHFPPQIEVIPPLARRSPRSRASVSPIVSTRLPSSTAGGNSGSPILSAALPPLAPPAASVVAGCASQQRQPSDPIIEGEAQPTVEPVET